MIPKSIQQLLLSILSILLIYVISILSIDYNFYGDIYILIYFFIYLSTLFTLFFSLKIIFYLIMRKKLQFVNSAILRNSKSEIVYLQKKTFMYMNRNNKIALKLLVVSIIILILVRFQSFLNFKYNISISDKYDIIDNIVWFAAIISIYILIASVLFLLFVFIRTRLAKK